MEKPQQSGESLSTSDQLPSFKPADSPNVEHSPRSSQGVFAWFEKASLRTQQLVTAITAGVISSLAVVAVIQVYIKTGSQPGLTALSQFIEISLAALVTAVIVGAIAWALGQISTNQINRSIDELQAQCNAVARGDLAVQPTVDTPKELGELVNSFKEMTLALDAMLSQANQKAKEQEKAKEDLQSQLIQLQRDKELAEFGGVIVDPEGTIDEQDDAPLSQGKLIDIVAKMQGGFEAPLNVEAATSSTLEEIMQYREELQYRSAWLEALLKETQREIQFISFYEPNPEEESNN
jgi:HAMP domain-containing protein